MVILSTASRRLAEFHGYNGRRYPGAYEHAHVMCIIIIIIQILLLRPAAPSPGQDTAQETGAAAHLHPGRGVEEDRSQEVRVPAPGHAKIRATEEDCGEDKTTQFVILTEQQRSCTCPVIVSLLMSLCL